MYGVSKEIDGKTFIFRVNLGMWALKLIVLENEPCSESSNTHLCSCQADSWKNIHFSTKPRHVTPQIDGLVEMNPVLMVSSHISGNSNEIDEKTSFLE